MRNFQLIILSILVLGALSQTCENYNVTSWDSANPPSNQYSAGTDSTGEFITVCTCPAGTSVESNVCVCDGAHQTFDGKICKCLDTYVKVDSTCVFCASPCLTCDASGVCQLCEEGYVLTESNTCDAVSSDVTAVLLSGGQVIECPGGCSACSLTAGCTGCEDGYYQSGVNCANCQEVGQNCLTCSAANGCETCPDGFFQSGTDCVTCPDNCLECDGTQCLTCIQGMTASGNTCVACADESCISCSNNFCSACSVGYTLIGGECIQCILGCNYCSPSDVGGCLGCSDGNYLSSGKCVRCKPECATCSSATNCTSCAEGYRLNGTNCVPACIFPCLTCGSDPNACKTCYGGYKLSGSKCPEDLSCNTDASCEFCPRSYFLEAGVCNSCGLPNCIACIESSGSKVCTKCAAGFAIGFDSTCQACPSECTTCTTLSFCSSCADGFYLYKVDDVSTGRCEPCSAEDACLACRGEPDRCLTCITGYKLESSACLSIVRVTFATELVGDPSTFYAVINVFKDGILSRIGLGPEFRKKVILDSIVSGSTVVSGSISMDNASAVDGLATTLGESLAANPDIDGLEVISSSVVATQEEAPPVDEEKTALSRSRVGMIVGFSLLGVALIAIVVIVVIGQKNKDRDQMYEKSNDGDFESNNNMHANHMG